MPKKPKLTVAQLEQLVDALTQRVEQLEMRVDGKRWELPPDATVPSEPLSAHVLWRQVVDDMRHYDESTGYDLRGYL